MFANSSLANPAPVLQDSVISIDGAANLSFLDIKPVDTLTAAEAVLAIAMFSVLCMRGLKDGYAKGWKANRAIEKMRKEWPQLENLEKSYRQVDCEHPCYDAFHTDPADLKILDVRLPAALGKFRNMGLSIGVHVWHKSEKHNGIAKIQPALIVEDPELLLFTLKKIKRRKASFAKPLIAGHLAESLVDALEKSVVTEKTPPLFANQRAAIKYLRTAARIFDSLGLQEYSARLNAYSFIEAEAPKLMQTYMKFRSRLMEERLRRTGLLPDSKSTLELLRTLHDTGMRIALHKEAMGEFCMRCAKEYLSHRKIVSLHEDPGDGVSRESTYRRLDRSVKKIVGTDAMAEMLFA